MTASNNQAPTSTKAPQATSDLPLDHAGEHPMMSEAPENKPILGQPFATGKVVMTQGIAALVEANTVNPLVYLNRHVAGDWGDLGTDDWAMNNEALSGEGRLFSSYTLPENPESERLWIITEWDRSVTTLLLPSEY